MMIRFLRIAGALLFVTATISLAFSQATETFSSYVNGLPSASSLTGSETFPLIQSGVASKSTVSSVANSFTNHSGGFLNALRNSSQSQWKHWWFQVLGTNGATNITIGFASFTGSIAAATIAGRSVLTVSAVSSGTISLYQQVAGTGVANNSYIVGNGTFGADCNGTACTGTGGTGTYLIRSNAAQIVSSEAMTSAGGWCMDGVYVIPTGAAVTCTNDNVGGGWIPGIQASMNIVGASGNTGVTLRFPLESAYAQKMSCNADFSGNCYGLSPNANGSFQATFQANIRFINNNSNQPTLETKGACNDNASCAAVGDDDWQSPKEDLAQVNLQQCTTAGSVCTLAYSFPVNAGAEKGYEVNLGIGAIGNGQTFYLLGADFRRTPGVSTGLVSSPPAMEQLDVQAEAVREARYVQTIGPQGLYSTGDRIYTLPAIVFASTDVLMMHKYGPTPLRCSIGNVTNAQQPSAVNCPIPVVMYEFGRGLDTASDLNPIVGGAGHTVSAISIFRESVDNVIFDLTTSGATVGQAGWVDFQGQSMFLVDSDIPGG